MGRYRVSSATTDIDRRIAEELDVAERSILRAIREAELHDRSVEERSDKLRTRRVGRDLKKVLATLSEVGRIANPYVLASEKGPIAPPKKVPPPKKIPQPKKIEPEKKIPATPPLPPPSPAPRPLVEDEDLDET